MGEAFTEYVTGSNSNVLFHSQTTCTTGCDSAFINTDKLNVKVS